MCTYKFKSLLLSRIKPDWSIGPQPIVLGLIITLARQFIELNSRYSCEKSSHFIYLCLSIAPLLFRFLSLHLSPTSSSRVTLPRIAVVIENKVDLIEQTSYLERGRCACTRFALLFPRLLFSEWRNYTAKMTWWERTRDNSIQQIILHKIISTKKLKIFIKLTVTLLNLYNIFGKIVQYRWRNNGKYLI